MPTIFFSFETQSALAFFALNARAEQFNTHGTAVRLPRMIMQLAAELEGRRVLLYAARSETNRGYFGTAQIGELVPDPRDKKFFWLCLYDRLDFDRPVTPIDLRTLGIGDDTPFQSYSRALREIDGRHAQALVDLNVVPPGFNDPAEPFEPEPRYRLAEDRVRSRAVRFQMLDIYGPKCAFSDRIYPSLDGLRFGVDQGHLRPLYASGPDVIQNVLPMSKDANWHWDEGIYSLTNGGQILVAKDESEAAKSLIAGRHQVEFPDDPQLWPNAEYLEFHRDMIFEKGSDWIEARNSYR